MTASGVPRAPETLPAEAELTAVGRVDLERAELVHAWSRHPDAGALLGLAAQVAPHLFTPPGVDSVDDPPPDEVVVVSDAGNYAFAQCRHIRGQAVIGIGRVGGSLGLLVACVRSLRDETAGTEEP